MKQYNYCLDFIKGLACIFVVFMHCEFPGYTGIIVQAISRFCVPLFFMVSGYFAYTTGTKTIPNTAWKQWLFNKKVRHILFIVANASLLYFLFVVFQSILFHNINWSVINLERLFHLLIFNRPFIIAGQYWFLFALLYVYLMHAVVDQLKLYKYAYVFAGLMFVAYIVLAQGLYLAGFSVPNMLYRNFLIEGFAYFMLGHWIHKNQSKLDFKNSTILAVIAISTFLCLIERYLLGRDFGVNVVTIPQVSALFIYAINNPNKHKGLLQRIGKDYSLYIYILHPIVWHSLEYLYDYSNLYSNIYALYLMPILVLIFSFLLSYIVSNINQFISRNKYQNA